IDWQRLPDVDWVSESLSRLDRVTAGRFTVRGSHLAPGRARIELVIDAGQAFGTGHHPTTAGCLEAITHLSRLRRFARPLDLGTGSGVLAMAMARLWRVAVLAVDVDPIAVRAARANARRNRLGPWIEAVVAGGLRAPAVRRRAPFDLVVANILAGPLARMAPDLARRLAPGGIAVLSGLLADQQAGVAAAYRAQGLRLVRRDLRQGWATLTVGAR
ncbi:MAG TPA: 50S ribosomal protein L11 methyltransferase, partial [Alphaproteobacteria bacterium]